MALKLLNLPTEVLDSIVDLLPIYDVGRYSLTCKRLFAISARFIKIDAERRIKYGVLATWENAKTHSTDLILDTILDPDLSVYPQKLVVSSSPATWGRRPGTLEADELAIGRTDLAVEEASSLLLPPLVFEHLREGVRTRYDDCAVALAFLRLPNITEFELLYDGQTLQSVIDVVECTFSSKQESGAILQKLTKVAITGYLPTGADVSYLVGTFTALPLIRRLEMNYVFVMVSARQLKHPLSFLSSLTLYKCIVTCDMLFKFLSGLKYLREIVFTDGDPSQSSNVAVRTWNLLDIIRKAGYHSYLECLVLDEGERRPRAQDPYIGTLHDFRSLKDVRMPFQHWKRHSFSLTRRHNGKSLVKTLPLSLQTLWLDCHQRPTGEILTPHMPEFCQVINCIIMKRPSLSHLHINGLDEMGHVYSQELCRICDQAGVILHIGTGGSIDEETENEVSDIGL